MTGSLQPRSPQAVSILGIPYDVNSSYLRGPALAPPLIRKALHCDSSNMWTEDGVDLGQPGVLHDAGDLELAEDAKAAFTLIEKKVGETLDLGNPLISLGGDHSVTYPELRAFHKRYRDLTILHFDAHPDLYDVLDGNRLSHACPFARSLEEGLANRLVQVGIRTMNAHQWEQAKKFHVDVISMRELARLQQLELGGSLFISLDIDVLDPAFAPGISHYEPGGMSVREVVACIQDLRVPILGADIVEYNPTRDQHEQTAMVCGKFLKEIAAAMLRNGKPPRQDWV
ncbi:MAG TPA: agmatinase [Terriglobales bacterium]|jgi:agmatinase